MRLNEATLDWLIRTRDLVDQVAAAGAPSFGWCGTERSYWNLSEFNHDVQRVWKLAGLPRHESLHPNVTNYGKSDRVPQSMLIDRAPTFFVSTCRTLQDLQPLYLIPRTPENATRITAQTRLVCSLYRLAVWLGQVNVRDPAFGFRFKETSPLHSRFSAYLLAELQTAKKAGVLPLTAYEAVASR